MNRSSTRKNAKPLFKNISNFHDKSLKIEKCPTLCGISFNGDNSICSDELEEALHPKCITQSTPARQNNSKHDSSKIKRSIKRKSTSSSKKNRKYKKLSENDNKCNAVVVVENAEHTHNDSVKLSDILLSKTIDDNFEEKGAVIFNDECNQETNNNKNETLKSDDNLLNQCLSTSSSFFEESTCINESQIYNNESQNNTITELFVKSNIMENTNIIKDDQMFADLNVTELILSNDGVCDVYEYPVDTFYALPMKAKDTLTQNRGISKLYDWQHDCLCLPAIFKRQNMVYSLPTSGGKTLVAEILIMKEMLIRHKNVILVLPYVSIVQEKVRGLSPFAVDLGFHIEEYAASKGTMPPKKRRNKKSVYIATIEKANAIVNSLIEHARTDELGMVVVDELHMIGEGGGRGALLEILLSKVLFKFPHVQIVGMSATLGNMDEIKHFLNAQIYTNDFRPVQLTEFVKIEENLYQLDPTCKSEEDFWKMSRIVAHPKGLPSSLIMRDPDHVLSLVLEVVPNNSCLVFCATKKNCESLASMLAKSLPKEIRDVKKTERKHLLKSIHDAVNGVCPTLRISIPFGIAYHHSGLTMDERKLIEEAYSSGVLCLLCCTSTLAAGVNLPAKRVILRSPYVGNKFMTRSQYKQMIGRAGRAGIDTSGESILILSVKDKLKAQPLLDGPISTCKSSLFYQDGKGLRELILSLLGLNICNSYEEIESFFHSTLFHVQHKDSCEFDIMKKIKKEGVHLINLRLVYEQIDKSEQKSLVTTDLGRATLKGCVDIDLAPFLHKQFKQAQCGFILANELHLLYLATPLDQVDGVRINWMRYYQQVNKLSPNEIKAAEYIGVTESFVCRKATGQRCSKDNFDEFVYKRFYLTLMLYELMKKRTIWQVADLFEVARGFLQNLLSSSISFTSLLIHFTEELSDLWTFKLLLQALLSRITNTNNMELAPLLDIPGVKQARARQLYKSGYHTLQDIAHVEAGKLCSEIEYLPRKQAQLIISSAKMLLQEKIEALREEADEISAIPTEHKAMIKS